VLTLEELPLATDVAWDHGSATVAVRGEVDLATAPEVQERLLKVIDKAPERLIVDLAGLAFIDCAGVTVLERVYRESRRQGCPMVLRAVHGLARRVFALTGLDQSCPIVD
jgi:anti-sigma B factor antagonist